MSKKLNTTIRDYYDSIAEDYDGFYLDNISTAENNVISSKLKSFVDREKSLIDFFCGTGLLLDLINIPHKNYTGLDMSTKMTQIAAQKYPGAKFINTDVLDHKSKKKFDIATALFSTNLIIEEGKIFKIIDSVLKNNGRFFIMLPSQYSIKNILDMEKSNKNSFDKLKEYNIRNCRKQIENYPSSRFYSSTKIRKHAEKYFTDIEIEGFNFFVEPNKHQLKRMKTKTIERLLKEEARNLKEFPDLGFYLIITGRKVAKKNKREI